MNQVTAYLTLFLYWIVAAVFRMLPIIACWRLGECLGLLIHFMMPAKRKIVRRNLEIVAAHTDNFPVSTRLIKDVFRRSFANLTCALKTYTMEPEELLKITEIELPPRLLEDLQNKRGSIHCLAHMGNWEILSKVFMLQTPGNQKLGAIFRPLDSPHINKLIQKERERYGCIMFPKGTPIASLSRFVKEGNHLGILADQRVGKERKYAHAFFGRDSARSRLPALLKRRAGRSLYMVANYSTSPGRWRIEIIPIESTSDNTEELLRLITEGYERLFRAYLTDVFWLHDYWRIKRKPINRT